MWPYQEHFKTVFSMCYTREMHRFPQNFQNRLSSQRIFQRRLYRVVSSTCVNPVVIPHRRGSSAIDSRGPLDCLQPHPAHPLRSRRKGHFSALWAPCSVVFGEQRPRAPSGCFGFYVVDFFHHRYEFQQYRQRLIDDGGVAPYFAVPRRSGGGYRDADGGGGCGGSYSTRQSQCLHASWLCFSLFW